MRRLSVINESINLDGVGKVDITWDFDEEDYLEWIEDSEYENNEDSLSEYIRDCVSFDLEYFDNETYHSMGFDTADYSDLESEFGESMTNRIMSELKAKGESSFETQELYNSEEFNVDNPDELNAVAVKILNHGEYYKDCRGFILTNGVIVYTPAEHNMVSQIDGIKGTFDFIRRGNIRILNQSIDLAMPPTSEQKSVLRQVISSYSDEELYVDIFTGSGTVGAHYTHPDWRVVISDIDKFFSEGIRPQGSGINESVHDNIDDIRLVGMCDLMSLMVNGRKVAKYSYEDSTAYPFAIFKGNLYIGESGWTHMQLAAREGLNVKDDYSSVACGRIWVKAKVNEFNHSVVSFWSETGCDIDLKPYVYELARKLKVNSNKIVVAFGDINMLIIPLSEWDGRIGNGTEEEKQHRNLHMMNAAEKHDNTGDFRNTRDKKVGNKLAGSDGKEMPMAQYHNMIYQEAKNVVISKEQYDRLFECKTKNVLISEEQYNRLFKVEKRT